MPKRIREGEDIYIAPGILGKYRGGNYFAIDERNGENRLNPHNIDDKILIYERQVNDWFLNHGSNIISQNDSGFIVLMICMSYLEGVEQYRQGRSSNNGSKATFIQALHRMYPGKFNSSNDRDLKRLYEQSRVGLFHDGMVRGDIIINNSFTAPISFTGNDIKINPAKLLLDIKNDFQSYIADLKNGDNIELRNNFDNMFSVVP